jgi:hypothetical protein
MQLQGSKQDAVKQHFNLTAARFQYENIGARTSRSMRLPARAHTADQAISVVTVQGTNRSADVVVVLAVVSEALRRPAASPSS